MRLPDTRGGWSGALPGASYPGWLKPFVPLVKSYGVPRYGEFDPTLPFAFTHLLLFGAMFSATSAMARSSWCWPPPCSGNWAGWHGSASPPGPFRCCSACSYGSIFGYEDVIEPVWLAG